MSRIRSLHPSLFTDEAYMGLSMSARVILPGIWTECDDQGVFAWKPLTLKARLLPADAVDMLAIMFELARGNFIRKFTVDGKDYGAVRNFRKYQRPKKPTATYPLPVELRTYVGLPGGGGEPVPHQSPTEGEAVSDQAGSVAEGVDHRAATSGESRPQMEDEGDKVEDEGGRREREDAPAREAAVVAEKETIRPWRVGDPIPALWKVMARETRRKLGLAPCNLDVEAIAFTSYHATKRSQGLGHQAWINWCLKPFVTLETAAPSAEAKPVAEKVRHASWDRYPEIERELRKDLGEGIFNVWLGPCTVELDEALFALLAPRPVMVSYNQQHHQSQIERRVPGRTVVIGLMREADDGLSPPAFLNRVAAA